MQKKGIFLVLLTAIISGLAIFIAKFGVSVINPYIFTGLKNALVAVLIISMLVMMKDWKLLKKLTKKQWSALLIIGLIGGSIPFLLFYKGLTLTTGAQASFIHKSMFIFIALLATLFLKEKVNKNYLLAGFSLLAGNYLLIQLIPHGFGLGDGLILMATLLWAAENVISKKLVSSLPPRIVMWGRMFFGSMFIFAFWVATGQLSSLATLNLTQLGWVMITSVLLLGYVATWYTGLKYIKVSTAAVILALGGPVTAMLSYVFLHQGLTMLQGLGIVLIILAAGLVVGLGKIFNVLRKLVYVRA